MADDKKKERGYSLSDMEDEKTYLKTLFDLYQKGRQFCIQGIVKAYDRETGLAKVLPLVNRKDGVKVDPVEVPVMNFCHGGFIINMPIFEGDTGYIIAGDKNAANAMKRNAAILKEKMGDGDYGSDNPNKNYGPVKANDDGFCKFQFGFFIPCNWAKKNTEFVKNDKILTIASVDGENLIEIGGDNKVVVNGMKEQEIEFVVRVYYDQDGHVANYDSQVIKGLFHKVGDPKKKLIFPATELKLETDLE